MNIIISHSFEAGNCVGIFSFKCIKNTGNRNNLAVQGFNFVIIYVKTSIPLIFLISWLLVFYNCIQIKYLLDIYSSVLRVDNQIKW